MGLLFGCPRQRLLSLDTTAEPAPKRARLATEGRRATEGSTLRRFGDGNAFRCPERLFDQQQGNKYERDRRDDRRMIRDDAKRARPIDTELGRRVRVPGESDRSKDEADEQCDLNDFREPSAHETSRCPPSDVKMSRGFPASACSQVGDRAQRSTCSDRWRGAARAPRAQRDFVVREVGYPVTLAQTIANATGAKLVDIPLMVGGVPEASDYISFIVLRRDLEASHRRRELRDGKLDREPRDVAR